MRKTLAFLLALSIFSLSTVSVSATDQPWFKGAAHTRIINNTDSGRILGTVSAAAYYDPGSGFGRGYNRVRVWSRTFAVKEYYDSTMSTPISTSAWVNNVFITNEAASTVSQGFGFYNWEPKASSTSVYLGTDVWYDILGLAGVPTWLLAAHVNKINTRVAITNSGVRSYTIELRNPDLARDLPWGAATNQPDAHDSVFNQLSSYQAKFWYDLPSENPLFPFNAKARLTYTYRYYDINADTFIHITASTNEIVQKYTVN